MKDIKLDNKACEILTAIQGNIRDLSKQMENLCAGILLGHNIDPYDGDWKLELKDKKLTKIEEAATEENSQSGPA